MVKTWGKDIWEKKSVNQNGITVSGGVVGLIRGKKKYFESMKRTQDEVSDFLKKHKDIKDVLEIGPGPDAINARFFLSKGYNLDLADCSPNTLRLAKEKLGDAKVGLYEQDMIELDIPKNYDLIFILGTFLHCPSHLSMVTMNNFNKQLKKGGFLIIDFPIKYRMTLKKGLWEGFYSVGHKIKTKLTGKNFYVTCGEYTYDELEDIFKRTNFKLIQHKNLWILQKL